MLLAWEGSHPPAAACAAGGRSGRGLPRAARCAADPPGADRSPARGTPHSPGASGSQPCPPTLTPPELLPLGSPGSELQDPTALHRHGFGGEGTIRFTGFGLQVLPTCSSVS